MTVTLRGSYGEPVNLTVVVVVRVKMIKTSGLVLLFVSDVLIPIYKFPTFNCSTIISNEIETKNCLHK